MFSLLHQLAGITVPATIPVALTVLSLYFGVKAYRRKSGAYVRGVFTPCQSRDCNDLYVSEVVLENLKDRAVTVFSMYLRVDYGYYIQIEDFEDKPLILRPYETYRKAFGPIEFYGFNGSKIDLNDLLSNDKLKKQLFLSTSDGKYRVRSPIRRWTPLFDYFNNHLTVVVRPVRSMHKEQALGGNMKFAIDFVEEDGNVTTVPIHPKDYELEIFRDFRLTRESLESKESLEQFLQKQKEKGKLACKSVIVYDLQSWRTRAHDFYTGKTIKAKPYGLFHYYVLGRVYSIYVDWRATRNNLKQREVHQRPNSSVVAAAGQPVTQGEVMAVRENPETFREDDRTPDHSNALRADGIAKSTSSNMS